MWDKAQAQRLVEARPQTHCLICTIHQCDAEAAQGGTRRDAR